MAVSVKVSTVGVWLCRTLDPVDVTMLLLSGVLLVGCWSLSFSWDEMDPDPDPGPDPGLTMGTNCAEGSAEGIVAVDGDRGATFTVAESTLEPRVNRAPAAG